MPPWKRSIGGRPSRCRCRLRSRRPCSRPTRSARSWPVPPDRPPEGRARRPQPDREERHARLDYRVDVGDQGRQRDPGPLGGEGRGKGEDVADDDVRAEVLQQRQQRPRRLGGVLAVVGIGFRRREHAVFLGRGEAEPGALDRPPALLPGLDHDLVPARRQRPPQRDRREDVPGVAECGDEDSQAPAHAHGSSGGIEALARSGEDDLRHVAVGRSPQQEADRLAEVLRAGSSPRPGSGPGRTRSSGSRRSPAPAPCTGSRRRPPRGGSTG